MRLFLCRFPALEGLQLFALICAAVIGIASANAATLIVTNTNDSGPGSLRQALADAQNGDIIGFDPSLNGQSIALTSGELVINKHVTINGPGPSLLTVRRTSGTFRIFHITPAHTVTISGVTIRDGQGEGGGILNDNSIVSLNNCVVRENFSDDFATSGSGGGIYNNGSGASATMTIIDSSVNNNRAARRGGGITNNGDGGVVTLSLIGSRVDNNSASYQGAPAGYGDGGGIYNSGQVNITLTNSSVSHNSAGAIGTVGVPGGSGGGIYGGTLTIINSTFTGNAAFLGGGGIYGAQLTMTNSTVSENINYAFKGCSGPGGGIWINGGTITNSLISGNSAWVGGGLYGVATLINSTIINNVATQSGGGISGDYLITNCTISQNSANQGGGIYGGGNIAHTTISDNSASQGGGIYANAMLEIRNTILKTGATGANLFNNGTIISHGYNLSSDNGGGFLTGPGDQINTDPLLGPLQDNGGPTFTHSLLTGSPALDAGDPSFTPPPLYDQRGFGYARVFNGRIDIGALEVQPPFISGTVSYCSNPALDPVPGVTMTLTGTTSAVTTTDANGNYTFATLASGGSYTATPTQPALVPGTSGINTSDAIAVQRHFLSIGTPLSGCQLMAADVNIPPNGVNTSDAIAIQRFFLSQVGGLAQTGTYVFNPPNKSYSTLVNSQAGQNYDALILGDVATGFVHPPEGSSQSDGISAGEVSATIATLSLPKVAIDALAPNLVTQVTTSAIDAKNNLVGFQGDFTFDERVVTFQQPPVQPAGLTAHNWNVSGNVLPGKGPIKTLRVSAFSLDFAPLSGTGTLFELRMTRMSQAAQSTQLIWAAGEDQFIFIDADLNTQKPINAAPGSITSSGKRK